MSERLPYEDQLKQQWHELPLPDENDAWADMKRRLEEDDDRTPIAWWRRGCALWGLLLLMLMGAGWFLFKPQEWFFGNKKDKTAVQDSSSSVNKEIRESGVDYTGATRRNTGTIQQVDSDSGNNTVSLIVQQGNPSSGGNAKNDDSNTGIAISTDGSLKDRQKNNVWSVESTISQKQKRRTNENTGNKRNSNILKKDSNDSPVIIKNDTLAKPRTPIDSPGEVKMNRGNGNGDSISQQVITKTDTVKRPAKKDNSSKPANTSGPSKGKPVFFSGGIAMQQLIPVGGQKLTPYSSSGRKGSLLDYIPSVYVRLNKKDENDKDKWFIQGEFKYGAPQYTKQPKQTYFSKVDTLISGQLFERSSATIKKTFYHQIPLTFNYYITPGWSIGTGIIFNKFSNSVTELKKTTVDIPNNDSTQTTRLVSEKSDSVFARSYLHAVVETQYKYKRFSFGARYAMGLQPFITFTLPGGVRSTEKNTSVQIFVRYELFPTKKDKK